MARVKGVSNNNGSQKTIRSGLFYEAGSDPLEPLEKPELVFGIVGPVGVDRKAIYEALEEKLCEYKYKVHKISMSSLIELVPAYKDIGSQVTDEYSRIDKLMTAGTEIREKSSLGDALALLAMSEIARLRAEANKRDYPTLKDNDASLYGRTHEAYVLDSLKHPDEVHTLRATYGAAFSLISVHTDRQARIESLAKRIAYSKFSPQDVSQYRSKAEALINRDEKEQRKKYGQNVEDTFPMADLFLDVDNVSNSFCVEIDRFLQIIFNHPFRTPSVDEWGMFHAEAASWRSADLSRQVGSSICSQEGALLAVGCNEVPKAFGGLYWEGDKNDGRDFTRGMDEGGQQKRLLVTEIIQRIIDKDVATQKGRKLLERLKSDAVAGKDVPLLEGVQALNVIEYGRTVHAEMAALSDAARRGISVQGCTMYVNTFPCHICARHIVASGIGKVIYVQPYPKSLSGQLFSDSISVDSPCDSSSKVIFRPFSGVAPRMYQFAFKKVGSRKEQDGKSKSWSKEAASTKLKRYVFSYIAIESQTLLALLPIIAKLESSK